MAPFSLSQESSLKTIRHIESCLGFCFSQSLLPRKGPGPLGHQPPSTDTHDRGFSPVVAHCTEVLESRENKHGGVGTSLVVENLPPTAEDTGSIPSWGAKIPQAAEHLSPCTTSTEPECHK